MVEKYTFIRITGEVFSFDSGYIGDDFLKEGYPLLSEVSDVSKPSAIWKKEDEVEVQHVVQWPTTVQSPKIHIKCEESLH